MRRIVFDDMCHNVLECEHYIEWDHEEEIWDHNRQYVSRIECASCIKVGESFNILEYPADCPHKETLIKFAMSRELEIIKFEDQCEKDKIWKRLNDI